MDKVIDALLPWVKKNLKSPKLYITVFVLIIAFTIVFPYIDANFFFYGRIEKRISVLQNISELDVEKIAGNSILEGEYNSILSEISEQREFSLFGGGSSAEQSVNRIRLYKFISGGLLSWLIMISVIFMKTFNNFASKISGFILMGVIGVILGGFGILMPTIINPWVNYIGYPALQFISLIVMALRASSGDEVK